MKPSWTSWALAWRRQALVASCMGWIACSGVASQQDVRSPDELEPPRTSDDQVLGADNVSASHKLKQGVRVGTGGVQPAQGWVLDGKGLRREREQGSARHVDSADAGVRE